MAYAYVQDGTIGSVGAMPVAARRQDTGEWVMGLRQASPELQQATGWYAIQNTAQPADTPTTTHDRSVELVDHGDGDGPRPTVVWTERAKTAAELQAETDEADRETKRSNYQGAVATLRQWADDAEGITVTTGNAVNVLQQLVDRSGTMWDRLADLIEAEHG
jgi:hypothetical protein